jgi:hypothetical protein
MASREVVDDQNIETALAKMEGGDGANVSGSAGD